MSARTVTIEEACAHIAELLASAAQGQEIVVVRDTRPVARLGPAGKFTSPSKRKGLFGCLKGKITLAEDFDAPLSDFKAYMR